MDSAIADSSGIGSGAGAHELPPVTAEEVGLGSAVGSSSATSTTAFIDQDDELFPDLLSKTEEELEALLDETDDSYFQEYFRRLPEIAAQLEFKRNMMLVNESLARRNLAHEGELQALRESIRTQFDTLEAHQTLYREHRRVYEDERTRFSPACILSKFETAVTDSEDLTESIMNSFLEGRRMSAEDFVKQFREVRKVYHMRAAKLARVKRKPAVLAGKLPARPDWL
ncbi:hypothetical protein HK102_000523 [Quaeritorhiza haematococci]|nr:hypothetical protein HK102_000523 [Quaeritorhiza haematococci]